MEGTSVGRWWVYLVQGIVSLILGIMLFAVTDITLSVLVIFLGAYWLVGGIFAIVGIFTGYSRAHWGWALFSGILGIAAGLLVMIYPLYSAVILPALLAMIIGIWGILMGVIGLVSAFAGAGWTGFLLGFLSIAFGVVVIIWPMETGLALVMIMGIIAIVGGVAAIVGSFFIRSAEKKRLAAA